MINFGENMGRAGISKSEVYNAAQIIADNGQIPTTQAIRNLLGSGSSSTIHKHLLTWKHACFTRTYTNMVTDQRSEIIMTLEKENAELRKRLKNLKSEIKNLQTHTANVHYVPKINVITKVKDIGTAMFFSIYDGIILRQKTSRKKPSLKC